jgi:hypothetical protein
MTERMSHGDYVSLQRRRAAAIASEMLCGAMGMVEGSRSLASLRHEVEVAEDDPDFRVFIAIVGEDRRQRASDVAERKADEIAAAEAHAREDGSEACRNLILRFRRG